MITYIHIHIAYWFDEFCDSNTIDPYMVVIRLWFVQNTYIFHYKIQTQLWDRRQKCQFDPVAVTTTFYMCLYLGIANNLVCNNGIVIIFVQGQSIFLNYGSNNFDYENGF